MKHFILFSLTTTLLLKVSQQSICTAVDQCSCRLSNGSEVALHQLDKHNDIAFKSLMQGAGSSFLINYNPCTTFVQENNCHGVLACQFVQGMKDQTFPLADPTEEIFQVDENENVIMGYSAVSPVDQIKRTFRILLICDINAITPQTSLIVEQPQTVFTLTLTHRCACAGVCSSDDPSSDKSSSLSTGSLLCILLLVFTILYLVGGILFLKYYKKNEGLDVIPNREFWMDFPTKVKDGCKLTWSKIRKKDSEYESI